MIGAAVSGIDEVSRQLGELAGGLRALDSYLHDHVHDMRQMPTKIDGLAVLMRKENEALKKELKEEFSQEIEALKIRTSALEVRMTAVESKEHRREGAVGIVDWVLKSPLIGWLVAICAGAYALFEKR